jgi:hypothetical protein
MKKLLASAALIAGLSMIALPASAQATGFAGASLGTLTADSGGTETDFDFIGAGGSVAFPVGSGLVGQANLAYTSVDGTGTEAENTTVSGNIGMRNANYAVGGYIGYRDNTLLGGTGDSAIIFGGEYVMYMPQMSISAGGGFGNYDDLDADVLGLEGELRYFVNDNLRIDGGVNYSKVEATGSEIDGFGGGIGAEWKPDNFPISVFGSFGFQPIDSGGTDTDLSLLQIGVRFDFGNNTLKARDRNGPAFKPAAGFGGPANTLF